MVRIRNAIRSAYSRVRVGTTFALWDRLRPACVCMTLQVNDLSKAPSRKVTPSGIVHVPRQTGWYRNYGKRVLDLVFVALGAVVAIPVILFLAGRSRAILSF